MAGSLTLGRYVVYDEIASGGMATVHLGRMHGAVGFSRTVAIKRLHAWHAKDPDFVSMFVDEARLAARIHHPNVVQTLDVVTVGDDLLLVMEYIAGESLARILRIATAQNLPIPIPIASAIVCGMLHGLHAAHEATSDKGQPLALVHRDVSPQNVLIGRDGIARVLDFGVAKATGRMHTTRDGNLKGKLGYMSPEQLGRDGLDRRSDVFAAGVVLWETLTAQRLFTGESDGAVLRSILDLEIDRPSLWAPEISSRLDAIVMRALERHPSKRFSTAREMAIALEACVPPANPVTVAAWLDEVVGDRLAAQAALLARIESNVGAEAPGGEAPGGEAPGTTSQVSTAAPTASEEHSQVSSVALTTSRRFRPPTPRWRRRLAYGVLAALLCPLAILLVVTRPRPSEPPSREPSTQVAPPAEALPVSETRAAPIPSAATTENHPAMPPSSSAPAERSASSPRANAAPKKRASASSKPAPEAKPCATSYVDGSGIKHYQSCP